MYDYSQQAIKASTDAEVAYCKFITPNDAGLTGAHQAGFYLHREASSLIWDTPRERGSNDDMWATINWQDTLETNSHFSYYGTATRNEYRLTNFGRNFPFLSSESVGNLLVLCKMQESYYKAYILSSEEEIESYLNAFDISVSSANGIITSPLAPSLDIEQLAEQYIATIGDDFPPGKELSERAELFYNQINNIGPEQIINNPDGTLVGWYETEFTLFKAIERSKYADTYLSSPFESVESLVQAANVVLNRRKSRAGKALENHIASIFDSNGLSYSAQRVTEGNKKPDFILPSIERYNDQAYNADKLVFLGVKTTCKDRWRQILNEAERTPVKHLFTLQPGISKNQVDEMKDEGVVLVVPEGNINLFAPESRGDLLTLKRFIEFAQAKTR